MTPLARYELAITRLTMRRAMLRSLYPRPDIETAYRISHLETRLDTLKNNAVKLESALTCAADYARCIAAGDLSLVDTLTRCNAAIAQLSGNAPSLQELNGEKVE